jgi:hypothetical protein
MNPLVKRSAIVLGIVLLGYVLYSQIRQDAKFNSQLKEIRDVRKAMEDSVNVLKERTALRDHELRDIIRRDMEIIDTLNVTLAKLNKSSNAIEQKIEENKQIIDRLWKTND